ncbi:DUF7919 family protein [Fodinicola feengrottensis]
MSEYPDLSAYVYRPSDGNLVNIGWLGSDIAFETGDVEIEVRDQLVRRVADRINVMRGVHYCDFCDEESPICIQPVEGMDRVEVYLGMSEIRIPSPNGDVVYVFRGAGRIGGNSDRPHRAQAGPHGWSMER